MRVVVLFIVALLVSVLAADTESKKTNKKRDLIKCGDKKRNAREWYGKRGNTTAMCNGFFAATNDGTMTDQAQVRKLFFAENTSSPLE
jgi:hypothetical protein